MVKLATTMRLLAFAAFAILSPSAGGASAENYQDAIDAFTRGQPRAVAAFAVRRVECNHWAGEEPYDKERAAEIAKAVRRLRCEALEHEEGVLRHRYAKKPNVLKTLDAAADLEF
jgi:hypothetical protein